MLLRIGHFFKTSIYSAMIPKSIGILFRNVPQWIPQGVYRLTEDLWFSAKSAAKSSISIYTEPGIAF